MKEDFKTLRRKEDGLYISGVAVLVFSVWDIVRFVMNLIMNPAMLTDFIKQIGFEPEEVVIGGTLVVTVYILTLLGAILIRLFIFLGARAESKGKKRGWIYVIVAAVVLAFLVYSMVTDVTAVFTETEEEAADASIFGAMDTAAASGLLNLTSAFALLDIIVSSAIVKKIRKKYDIKDGEVI